MASNVTAPSSFYVLLLVFMVLHSLPQAKSCANHSLDATFSQLHLPTGCYGPLSITFDQKGEGPYTGSSDGRIFKYDADSGEFREFCVGNAHRYFILFHFAYQVCVYLERMERGRSGMKN